MSAILSADDLNDFISPGVACIKPIETLPPRDNASNPYEVTTEDKLAATNPAPAQISLTDCLACSGCVTSAEAVLVSLQSHAEVLNTLDNHPPLPPPWIQQANGKKCSNDNGLYKCSSGCAKSQGKLFVASVSPQARASLAAAYGISSEQADNMIAQLLSGPQGLAAGGQYGSSFLWILDTNILRSIALVAASEEVQELLADTDRKTVGDGSAITDNPKKPILTSACPGWICYAEKTHPHILPHLSRLKSPQALAGTLLKSVLYKAYNVLPSQVWHLAIMPCFDKKLEASRSELTSALWHSDTADIVRDVDCVITPSELISLASSRNVNFSSLPRTPLPSSLHTPFPDASLDAFLFPHHHRHSHRTNHHHPSLPPSMPSSGVSAGTSGGYLWHVLRRAQAAHPGSHIVVSRGRNADVVEYVLLPSSSSAPTDKPLLRCARYYGFRNIQNLVRRLKPARTSRLLGSKAAAGGMSRTKLAAGREEDVGFAFVEVMACPGGCTNGGGQIRVGEQEALRAAAVAVSADEPMPMPVLPPPVDARKTGAAEQKAWLALVDEAYYSAESDGESDRSVGVNGGAVGEVEGDAMDVDEREDLVSDVVDGISRVEILGVIRHWARITGVDQRDLLCTSFRKVESDVGKKKGSDIDRVVGLASSIGGGW